MVLRKFDMPTTVFFAIAVVSVILLAYPMWNYTRFYLALWNIDYIISDVSIYASESNNIRIDIELLVMNPTDYSGLEVRSSSCRLSYIDGAHLVQVMTYGGSYGSRLVWVTTTVWDLKVESHRLRIPLAPNENKLITLPFIINPDSILQVDQENARAFIGFVGTEPQEIELLLDCHLYISSFLGDFDAQRYLSYSVPMSYQ